MNSDCCFWSSTFNGLSETKAMERRIPRIIRNRLKRLKYLLYAVMVLLLVPCVVEFCLRVAACRQTVTQSDAAPEIEIVPSWTMHHQLKPMQTLLIRKPDDASGRNSVDSESASTTEGSDAATAEPDAPHEIAFRTNSHGLRGAEISVPKQPGVFRIVVLGDELVLAPHTSEEETFCDVLDKQLQDSSQLKVEVVNAGVPDFCPLLSYLQLRHLLLSLEPDLVVLQLSPNDVIDDGTKRRHTELGLGDIPLASIHPQLLTTPKTKPLSEHFLSWKLAENSLSGWLSERPTSGDDRELIEASISSPASQRVSRQDAVLAMNPIVHIVNCVAANRCEFLLALPPLTSDAWMGIDEGNLGAVRESDAASAPRTVLEQALEFAETRQIVVCNSTIKPPANDPDAYRSSKMSSGQHRFHAKRLTETIVNRTAGPWIRN